MRPGCDRPAAARLSYDPVSCELWLDELPARTAPVQELCEFHVERLTVPRGWTVTDRRDGVGGSTTPDGGARDEPAAASTAPAEDPAGPGGPPPDPEPDDRGDPGTRRGSRANRRPAAPLLERAFAWTGPQQSILTQPRREDEVPGS